MAGRWGARSLAYDKCMSEDAPGMPGASSRRKTKLSASAERSMQVVGGLVDQLGRDLRVLVKEYQGLDESSDFGKQAIRKIENTFDRCDKLRGIYSGIY